ncbi:Sds3-like-domain-containing protein [Geranomyces variabilis]|nr:Sds3-like-domain-containing protein [Geranomyces variabilis]KAJ3132763.1 hypothetical protein HDU90_006650 [Geranomyces variabilis]
MSSSSSQHNHLVLQHQHQHHAQQPSPPLPVPLPQAPPPALQLLQPQVNHTASALSAHPSSSPASARKPYQDPTTAPLLLLPPSAAANHAQKAPQPGTPTSANASTTVANLPPSPPRQQPPPPPPAPSSPPPLPPPSALSAPPQPQPQPPSSSTVFHTTRPSLLAVPEPGAIVVPVATPKKSHKARKPKAKAADKVPAPAPPPPAMLTATAMSAANAAATAAMMVDEERDAKDLYELEVEPPLTKKERKHKEMMERLERLNRDFFYNKDRIFSEKIAEFKDGARQVLAGTHPEFQDVQRKLEDDRNRAIAHAELFLKYQMESAARMFKHEHELAMTEYKRDREAVKERMLSVLEDKKRKVRDDRENFDVSHIVAETTIEDSRTGTRKATRSHAAKNHPHHHHHHHHAEEKKEKRRKIAPLPGLVVMASDEVAISDLSTIRRQRRR